MNPHLAAYLDSIDGVERPEQPPQSTHSELCGDKSVASRVERWGSCLLLISLRLWLVEAVVYLVYFTHEIALDIPLLRSAVSSIVMKYSCILLLMMAMPLTAFTWSVFAAPQSHRMRFLTPGRVKPFFLGELTEILSFPEWQ